MRNKKAAPRGQKAIAVSVVMPVYNAASTILSSVCSVIGQTFEAWELILIDDASGDSSRRVIEDFLYQQRDEVRERIRLLVNEKNLGAAGTRNRGVVEARCSWIAFLDSDDLWDSHKLEEQFLFLKREDGLERKQQTDLLYTGSAFINAEGRLSKYILHVPEQMYFEMLRKQNLISCSSVLVRRELLLRYPMENGSFHEDYALWLRLLADGYVARGIDKPLLIYRLSEKSRSGDKRRAAMMTYGVYRHVGFSRPVALRCLAFYTWRNMKKYYGIKQGFSPGKKGDR